MSPLPGVSQELEDKAAASIGFLAAEFVIQAEVFPVFKRWCQQWSPLHPAADIASLEPLVENLRRRMDEFHGQRNSGGDL